VLRLENVAAPEPGPGQVRIEVGAAALNFGDALLCRGRYHLRPPWPFTPGLEIAGRIRATGSGVGLPVGARVMAVPALPHGGLADQALADAANAYPIPDHVGDVDAAALLIAYQTSHVALHRRAGIRAGETLLVHAGAGGVGSAAIQLGVAARARELATAGGAEKVAVCRELGAAVAIDYRAQDFVEIVREATQGRGADVIYDPVGGDVFEGSTRCVAWEGRILVVGFAGGQVPTCSASHLLLGSYSVVGVYMGEYPARERGFLLEVHDELFRLHAAGAIRPRISSVALDDVPAALEDRASRRTVGKLVVRLGALESSR
jgi:NADPH2:quinone reductase